MSGKAKAPPTQVHAPKEPSKTQQTTTTPSPAPAGPTVAELFDNLAYGPAPESAEAANAWLDDHDRDFGLLLNNKWVKKDGRKTLAAVCPATGQKLANTTQADEEDVNNVVKSAKDAFETWSKATPHERAKVLYSVARHIQKHSRLLAVLESLDNGKPIRESRDIDIVLVARHFYHHAGWAQLMEEEMAGYKPLGVIAQIIPWNFPLLMLSWKIAPALAMGNTIVLKTASVTRLSALCFAEICVEAGVPPGVITIITGGGAMGSLLVDHPDVAKIAFTGSTDVGRLLRRRIAGSGKKVSLELGGKSPVVVYDTADLDSAVESVVDAIWFNQGQVCCAGSKLVVQESIADKFIQKLKRRMDRLRLGHPLDKCIDMGPLVSKDQLETVSHYVEQAAKEGATVYKANIPIPEGGFYFPPTLIYNVEPVATCVREEIFGPVLCAVTFRSPSEAIKLANNTVYGLAGSVHTENVALALETAISIKAGVIWVNCHNVFDAAAGFGGYRESGFGREGGREGLYEYAKPAWMERPKVSLQLPVSGPQWPKASAPGRPALPETPTLHPTTTDGHLVIDRTAKVYIGGKQRRPDGCYSRLVKSPSGEVVDQVGEGNRKDIRDAVEAAHAAAPGWGKRAAHNRAQICYYIAENLMSRLDEFTHRIMLMTGRSKESAMAEVNLSISRLFYYAAYADKFGGFVQETTLYGLTCSIHEPVGVIAIACPDEYPLLAFVSLVAPAIVRANTVVVIPSQEYPLCATDLYQVLDTSDLPGGVINIVTGERDLLTRTLVEHQDVDAMWYFGPSERGSANVEFVASDNMKRTFVNYGVPRKWEDPTQGQGEEFLRQAVQVKNVWVPMGDTNA